MRLWGCTDLGEDREAVGGVATDVTVHLRLSLLLPLAVLIARLDENGMREALQLPILRVDGHKVVSVLHHIRACPTKVHHDTKHRHDKETWKVHPPRHLVGLLHVRTLRSLHGEKFNKVHQDTSENQKVVLEQVFLYNRQFVLLWMIMCLEVNEKKEGRGR